MKQAKKTGRLRKSVTEYSENTGRDSNIELDNGSPLFHEKKYSTQVDDKNTEQNH